MTEMLTEDRVLRKPGFVAIHPKKAEPSFENYARLVFINGSYSEINSSIPTENKIYITTREKYFSDSSDERVEEYFSRTSDNKSGLANAAHIHSGPIIIIPENISIEKPIHVIFINKKCNNTNPYSSLIIVEACASAKIVTEYISDPTEESIESGHVINVVTQIGCHERSHVSHTIIHNDPENSFADTTSVQIQASANYSSQHIILSAISVISDLHVQLSGENAITDLSGLSLPATMQHFMNTVHVEHLMPHTTSNQNYFLTAAFSGKGAFKGKISVALGACQSDAKQILRGILLADEAEITVKPTLEIYHDDVKCSHGASVGSLDQEAIFYLRARGLSETEARTMLIQSHCVAQLSSITDTGLRKYLEILLEEKNRGMV